MLVAPSSTIAQDVSSTQPLSMDMPADNGWQLMQDGVLFAEFNHQGGPRGGNEFVAPNWWMGMASREASRGRLTFTGMQSLDPATVGQGGYREVFQAGEALNGRSHSAQRLRIGQRRLPLNGSVREGSEWAVTNDRLVEN